MLPAVHIRRASAATVRVNAGEVEFLLLQGWRLTDQPDCSGARMLPPRHVSVNRVPQKKIGQGGQSQRPIKSELHNAGHSGDCGRLQGR